MTALDKHEEVVAPARRERLVVRIAALALFESALYTAITPLLPHYARALSASKPAIGLLAGAYSSGLIPGSLLGAWATMRLGVRRVALAGLVVLVPAAVAFGFGGQSIVVLDALRLVQGVACGLVWTALLTWLVTAAPRQQRGRALGVINAAAGVGTLVGPLVGMLATAVGTRLSFSVVGSIGLALIVWLARDPQIRPWETPQLAAHSGGRSPLWVSALKASPEARLATWLIALQAITFGVIATLLPLRLSHFGATEGVVGATFIGASALSVALSPVIGRQTDIRGSYVPMTAALLAAAGLLALLPLPHDWPLMAALTLFALGIPLAAIATPAISLLTASIEKGGIPLVAVATLVTLANATGESIASPAGASIAQATSDAVPLFIIGGVMILSVPRVLRTGARERAKATSRCTVALGPLAGTASSPSGLRII